MHTRAATVSDTEHIGWKPASNGAHKRHWFVMHHEERLYYADKRGQLVWFGSCRAAQEKADQLNREHPAPARQDGTVWFSPGKLSRKSTREINSKARTTRAATMTATSQEPILPVVIRVWKDDPDDLFALFPTDPADIDGRYCGCYQHVGQHGSADYHGCIANSRPATEAEAAPLLEELRRTGYNLRVIRRAAYRYHEERRQQARAC